MAQTQQHILSSHEEILRRLHEARKKQQQIALLSGVFVSTFVVCLLILDAVLLERAFLFNTIGRTILFAISVFGIAGTVSWFVGRPLLRMMGVLRPESLHDTARLVGGRFAQIRDRLLNALEVYESRTRLAALYSPELIDAAFADLYREAGGVDFTEAVDRSVVGRMRRLASYAAGALALVFALSPTGFTDSADRLFHFNKAFATPAMIHLAVEPGNVEVVRGATVPVAIKATGEPVSTIVLRTRQFGQREFESRELRKPDRSTAPATVFRDSLPSIKSTTQYYAEVGDVQSTKFTVTVVDRPLIRTLRVELRYPAYTRLPMRKQEENVGDVSAYPGTLVTVDASSSKELSAASIEFSDDDVMPMSIHEAFGTAQFRLTKEQSYHIELLDQEGRTNIDPVEHQLKLVPDAFPTVAVLVPGKNVDIAESVQLEMLARIADDFGFSKLRLAYRLAQSRYEPPAQEFSFSEIPIPSKEEVKQEIWYRWEIAGMNLVPEDVVAYYVEVFDNDNVSGPKSARSEIYLLRLPSLDEVYRDVAEAQSHSMESLQSAVNDLRQIRKSMEELRNEMKNPAAREWQQQRKVEEMRKRFEQARRELQETSQKLEENIQRMQDNKMLSHETLEKYLELQRLMEEMNAPELEQALRKLQEAMNRATPEQLRDAMQRLQMSEELLRKSLERTIELLKRIAVEQKLDELLKRTEELVKQQENLREQTPKADPRDRGQLETIARRQEDLQKQLSTIRKELSDLKTKMEDFPNEMPLEEVTKAQKDLEQQQIEQHMQDAARQMRRGESQTAQASQQRVSQGMQRFLQQMQTAQKTMRESQQRQIVNEMRRALQDMLELSKRQEELRNESQSLDPNSARFRENAQKQMEILGDLANVTNSLTQLSRKTFAVSPELGREIGKAIQQMGQAMRQMEERNPGTTSHSQTVAMASLNRAAIMIQQAMDGMQGAGGMGMGGLAARLNQMSGVQAGINAESEAMMGRQQGLTSEQAAEWSRLAAEQGAVQKSLEELALEARQSGELSKLLGDLNKIAEEMREVQTDMEQDNMNPETLKKQERILSRLLDSQRSVRERDYEKRRRSETGKNVVRRSPGEIDLSVQEGRSKLRQELLKVLEQRYAKDYEELIRKYFEELEKEPDLQR